MLSFKEATEYCKTHPLKIDYTPYYKYGVVRIKSSMRKWKVYFDETDQIVNVTYTYRESKSSKFGGNYKPHYLIPRNDIMTVLRYIDTNEYHIPKININDNEEIERYAKEFGFEAEFTDAAIFLWSRVGKWKINYDGNKVTDVFRLNHKFNYSTKTSSSYWSEHNKAPKRNVAASIHYCYQRNRLTQLKKEESKKYKGEYQ